MPGEGNLIRRTAPGIAYKMNSRFIQEEDTMKNKIKAVAKKDQFTLALTLVALCLLMTALNDKFLSLNNFRNILRQSSQYGICAIGMTMLILLGGIDLSVGSVQALAGVAAVYVLNTTKSVFLGVLSGVVVGALVGLLNGTIITKMNITPLICTLGTTSVISGTALVITKAASVQVAVPAYIEIGVGHIFGIPIPVILLVILVAIFYYILNYTVFGRYIYAIGGNKESAKLAGIPVKRVTMIAYVLSGCLTGLSAVILSARMGSGQPSAGVGFEMTVIAAVIIGGVSLDGGKGSLGGAILGVITLYVLNNGLTLMGLSSFWQDIMRGALIVIAVFIDIKRQEKAKKKLLKEKFDAVEQINK